MALLFEDEILMFILAFFKSNWLYFCVVLFFFWWEEVQKHCFEMSLSVCELSGHTRILKKKKYFFFFFRKQYPSICDALIVCVCVFMYMYM